MLSPEAMERVAAAVYPGQRETLRAADFAKLLELPGTFAVTRPDAYLVFRVAGPEADIHSFAVAPEARNRGLGGDMLRDGLAQLHERGVREVYLEVETSNAAALRIYDRAGFFVIGKRPRYYRHADGSFGDAYLMGHYYGREDVIGPPDRHRIAL